MRFSKRCDEKRLAQPVRLRGHAGSLVWPSIPRYVQLEADLRLVPFTTPLQPASLVYEALAPLGLVGKSSLDVVVFVSGGLARGDHARTGSSVGVGISLFFPHDIPGGGVCGRGSLAVVQLRYCTPTAWHSSSLKVPILTRR